MMNVRILITGIAIAAALLAGIMVVTGGDERGPEDAGALAAAEAPGGPEAPAADTGAGSESPLLPVETDRSTDPGETPDGTGTPPESEGPATTGSTGSPGSTGDAGSEQGAAGEAGDGGAVEAPTPAGQDPTPEAILRATARAYEGLRSFRAGFEQVLENSLLGRTTRSRGTLYQRQPDRFLMEFSDPEGDLIVSDGDFFWMYFPSVDEKQVLRTPRGGQGLDLQAQFIGDPVRRFETTYHGTDTVRGRKAYVMTLVPREPMGYTRLKAWIDARDHLVRRFELHENSGNLRHFELHDLVANPSLPDDLFRFTPPPGSQVVTR
jgi:outer membrane lipoprotein carrier protein